MRLVDENYNDAEARELWSELSLKLPVYFKDISITPALLHGDLWSGNVSETKDGPGKKNLIIRFVKSFYCSKNPKMSRERTLSRNVK